MNRWSFATMGTIVSVAVPGQEPRPAVRAAVEEVFHSFDAEFSLYLPDSPISRVARGELALGDAGDRMLDTYAAALEWRTRTGGDFTPHRPDGVIDLSGIVKALAIEAAGERLTDSGIRAWSLGCGGDVLAAGDAAPGEPWTIGIADPDSRAELLTAVRLTGGRRAVATSGTAERGEHVWRTDDRSTLRQVSVVADDIVTADVLATAILAGGTDALDRLTRDHDVDALACSADGMVATPGMRVLIGAPA
ncbi:MAG TPA: FAD:protein FMN transferase [Pseudolysinimonas sp.]|nr:FAD:protein FMN transferase [Pseudolysinimonas sp.]